MRVKWHRRKKPGNPAYFFKKGIIEFKIRMILHYISVTFSHFKKGSKLLQGHAKKGSKSLQACVKGVVFYKVSFYLKRKKMFTSEMGCIRQPRKKIYNLREPLSMQQQKKKKDYSTSAWSRY